MAIFIFIFIFINNEFINDIIKDMNEFIEESKIWMVLFIQRKRFISTNTQLCTKRRRSAHTTDRKLTRSPKSYSTVR